MLTRALLSVCESTALAHIVNTRPPRNPMHPDYQLDDGITLPGTPARAAQDAHNTAIVRRAEKEARRHHRARDKQARLEALEDMRRDAERRAAQLRAATGSRHERQAAKLELAADTPQPEPPDPNTSGKFVIPDELPYGPAYPPEMQFSKQGPKVTLYDGLMQYVNSTWALYGKAGRWTATVGDQTRPDDSKPAAGSRAVRRALKKRTKP